MPPLNHRLWGHRHGTNPLFLRTRAHCSGVGIPHALLAVAERLRCPSPADRTVQATSTQATQSTQTVCRTGPEALPCVSTKPRLLTHRLWRHPIRCPRPLDAPAGSIPPGTSVPIRAVAIAAGSGWATCVPMGILMATPGDNANVLRARATFPSIMARSWFCQLVEADIVTRQTGTLPRSSLSLRPPAPCP